MTTPRLELVPVQPDPVAGAVATLLGLDDPPRGPDPWWEAGTLEALRSSADALLPEAAFEPDQGETVARPRRRFGAERA
jgi:hypothetical protein